MDCEVSLFGSHRYDEYPGPASNIAGLSPQINRSGPKSTVAFAPRVTVIYFVWLSQATQFVHLYENRQR